jgi:tetratricopeptide (TPR) repeat protein
VPFQIMRDQLNALHPARQAEALAIEPFAWRPTLWKARVLQFHGRRRPAGNGRGPATDELIDDHRTATTLYKSPEARPSPREVARASVEKKRIDTASQLNAAYWLGLLLFDDGNYDVAIQWLERDELHAPDSPWAAGARYNLGRAYEALGKFDEAISQYEKDTSPQRHGNRLRAKSLKAERDAQ